PFPGSAGRSAFALEPPAALRVSNITEEDDGSIRLDVTVGATGPALVAAPDEIRFAVLRGDTAPGRVVRVKPEPSAPVAWSAHASAKWLELVRSGDDLLIRADPTGLDSGVHTDTVLLVAAPTMAPRPATDPGSLKSSTPADTADAAPQPADSSAPDGAGGGDAGAAAPNQPAPRRAAALAGRAATDARAARGEAGRAGARAADAVLGRVVVHLDVAEPGARDVIATALPWSWGLAAHGGEFFQASYGWDPLALRPRPRVL